MSASLANTKAASVNPWLSHVATIESIQPEIESVATYHLRLSDEEIARAYRFQPGQFNMLYLPGCGESAISHSGSAGLDGLTMIHTIRFVGRVTHAIAALKVGDQLGVRGPFGTAWPMEQCRGQDVILMSGGLGLAPLRPAIYHLLDHREHFGRLVLLHGARSPDLILYANELDQWSKRGMEIQITVDRADMNWRGMVGVVPALLERLAKVRPSNVQVLCCGPEVMMHYSAVSALQMGIPSSSIWLSMERNMQCAVGLCGHCQLGPEFVCRDGPVFRYDRIRPLMKVKDF